MAKYVAPFITRKLCKKIRQCMVCAVLFLGEICRRLGKIKLSVIFKVEREKSTVRR